MRRPHSLPSYPLSRGVTISYSLAFVSIISVCLYLEFNLIITPCFICSQLYFAPAGESDPGENRSGFQRRCRQYLHRLSHASVIPSGTATQAPASFLYSARTYVFVCTGRYACSIIRTPSRNISFPESSAIFLSYITRLAFKFPF